jgi:glycosyltransferase involved in cell wall biosynthesis
MRILYLHQYYRTPAEGGGVRSYHVANALAEAGHYVHVITTWQGPVKRVQRDGNLLITSLPIAYDNAMPKSARIRAFWAFIWQSYREAKAWLPADRLFATSTPLTIGLVALLLKHLHKVPYVFEVRDCWPEAPIQLGAVKNKAYAWFLRVLEKAIYAQAEAIVALSPPISEHVQRISPHKKVLTVPNFADTFFFYSPSAPPSEPFHVVYAGTFGLANQVQRLLDLALACKKEQLNVRFTLAGDGAEKASANSFVKQNGLGDTVSLLPHLSSHAVRDLLGHAHAAYIGFRPEPVLRTNSPNKFFDALAAHVPILLGTEGWLANEVRQASCGIVLADFERDIDGLRALMVKDQFQLRDASARLAAQYDREKLVNMVVSAVANRGLFSGTPLQPVSL